MKIEEKFSVGEYDILILSAKESDGLQTWLAENGYKIPSGATDILGSYIKQNRMKFFVAKVNLSRHEASRFSYLRPLAVEFNTPKFMLPIRLGMVNATGPQELFIYTLTRKGRVEATNYRTVKLETNQHVPAFVRDDFARLYRDLFRHSVKREKMSTLFTEYAWDVGWCDPVRCPIPFPMMSSAPLAHRGSTEKEVIAPKKIGFSSRGCICAMTLPIFRKIWFFRKRATGRTFKSLL